MLFGHQTDTTTSSDTQATGTTPPQDDATTADVAAEDTTIANADPSSMNDYLDNLAPLSGASTGSVSDDPTSDSDVLTQSSADAPQPSSEPVAQELSSDSNDQASSQHDGDESLLALKQQALGELTPLVDHLEQSPEEKFRTTMMMIQSTDNKDLIKEAFAAAQAIPDDKARAQALLDVINEINYFIQQNH
ncbi:MAG: hypothetical protein WAQ24_01250 [Candidatus Saccharimonadales bacterium]